MLPRLAAVFNVLGDTETYSPPMMLSAHREHDAIWYVFVGARCWLAFNQHARCAPITGAPRKNTIAAGEKHDRNTMAG